MAYSNLIGRSGANPPPLLPDDVSALMGKAGKMDGYKGPPRKAKKPTSKATGPLKTTGTTNGKSNAKGMGGQSQQLLDRGVPQGVVGMLARKAGTAPGQPGFHRGKK